MVSSNNTSRIILADEATSSVDAETERLVHRAMEENFVGCTILTIAHRQSSLGNVDRIIRLHQGALAAGEDTDSDSGESDASQEL
ncbi:hypothetical protein G3M48_006461 [Beauveria asiatica]|uniref:ABC transporter domain-containing protein n=1 Tax=Beauveria asiatica TaxID=1069075 RepID=A0AAW0S5E7_9HYPO